jgi:hypothetical protein
MKVTDLGDDVLTVIMYNLHPADLQRFSRVR